MNGMSIAFTKIYLEIWINGTSIVHSQKVMFKNQVKNYVTYKYFWMGSLSCKQLPEQFTDIPYKAGMYVHYIKSYHGSLLTLVTCENIIILMDEEEHLRKK